PRTSLVDESERKGGGMAHDDTAASRLASGSDLVGDGACATIARVSASWRWDGASSKAMGDPMSTPLAGMRVLVVDDDGDARELLHELLQQRGAEVLTASRAGEAFEMLTSERPDALVSDIAMPDE